MGTIAQKPEVNRMNRKLGRLIQPGMGIYFLVMLAFALTALLMEHPVVAAAEAAVTAMLLDKLPNRNFTKNNNRLQTIPTPLLKAP